jgi:flagellin
MPIINHNIPALNAQRNIGITDKSLRRAMERLSTGLRINRAADDTAGLAVSQGMRAEITGLQQGTRNAEQAVNLIQVAEGSLNEIHAILTRMRELSVQAASDTVNQTNRESIQQEFNQLRSEINRIASTTAYNGVSLLTGFGTSVTFASGTTGGVFNGRGFSDTGLDSNTTLDVGEFQAHFTLSGAASGTYTFVETASTSDGIITLTNGTVSQTIDLAAAFVDRGSGVGVATGSTAVLNFDRLGVALTLDDTYTAGELHNLAFVIQGSVSGGTIQVGPRNTSDNRISIDIDDVTTNGTLNFLNTVSVGTLTGAQNAIDQLDEAISKMSLTRGHVGALQNRLGFLIASNNNAIENIQASESAIRDADVAEEVANLTRSQILLQAGTAMLAQANALPQNVLSLLQG